MSTINYAALSSHNPTIIGPQNSWPTDKNKYRDRETRISTVINTINTAST